MTDLATSVAAASMAGLTMQSANTLWSFRWFQWELEGRGSSGPRFHIFTCCVFRIPKIKVNYLIIPFSSNNKLKMIIFLDESRGTWEHPNIHHLTYAKWWSKFSRLAFNRDACRHFLLDTAKPELGTAIFPCLAQPRRSAGTNFGKQSSWPQAWNICHAISCLFSFLGTNIVTFSINLIRCNLSLLFSAAFVYFLIRTDTGQLVWCNCLTSSVHCTGRRRAWLWGREERWAVVRLPEATGLWEHALLWHPDALFSVTTITLPSIPKANSSTTLCPKHCTALSSS